MSKKERETEERREGRSFFQGSYTVEAALVMSITVFVLGALILLTFYVHDLAVAQSLACEIAAVGSNQKDETKGREAAEKAAASVNASRFLGSRNLSREISAGKSKSTASLKAEYPVPGFAMQYFSGGELSIECAWESDVNKPAKTIRLFRGLGDLAGNLIDIGEE